MNNKVTDDQTLMFYSNTVPSYSGSGDSGTIRHLQSFLGLLQPILRIIELGCVGGRDAEAMLQAGFDAVHTDGTFEIAKEAEKRLGRVVRVMRFDELNDIDAYDAVWANASFE